MSRVTSSDAARGDGPHQAVAERDLSFGLGTLIDARQEATGQPQSFL